MQLSHYAQMAKVHWEKFLPKYYHQLQDSGTLEHELEKAGEFAKSMIADLMETGLRKNEALEIALPQFILLTLELSKDQIIDQE